MIFFYKTNIEQELDKIKVSKFIKRVTSEEIFKDSPFFILLRKLLNRSIPTTIEKVVQKKCDAVDAIVKLSWEELGITKPTDLEIKALINNKEIEDKVMKRLNETDST